ncbi:PulJ/GspJ family protein [Oceanithermus sp.]
MRKKGFTLIETLLALAIFLVLFGMIFRVTVNYMQVRANQDATTTTQAKLRRIVEVFSQDIRSSVLGAITDNPYVSDNHNVSFAMLGGGAYHTLPFNSADYYTDISSLSSTPFIASGYALLVNNTGSAVVFRISSVEDKGAGVWRLHHNSCQNTIAYTQNSLAFPVRIIGIKYNQTQKELISNNGSSIIPYAFNITNFQIDYIYYDNNNNTTVINPTGYNPPDRPPYKQFGGTNGNRYMLKRLRLTLETNEIGAKGKTITRQLVSNVDLTSNATYDIKEVVPCN